MLGVEIGHGVFYGRVLDEEVMDLEARRHPRDQGRWRDHARIEADPGPLAGHAQVPQPCAAEFPLKRVETARLLEVHDEHALVADATTEVVDAAVDQDASLGQ